MKIFPWRSRDVKRDELDEELRAHLAMAVNDRVARGEDLASAELAARREFGNLQRIRTHTEDTWGGLWWEHLRQDLRYAVRGLGRNPGFTVTVALTFALGVGANAAVFSVLEPLMLRTPPGLVDAHRLHRVYHGTAGDFASHFSGAEFSAVKDAVNGQAIVAPRLPTDSTTLVLENIELPVRRELATAGYLPLLTGPAVLGRYFTADEGDARAPLPRAVLSHAFWSRSFAGDRQILGREVTIGQTSYTVVGVAARGFVGLDVAPVDVWTTAVHFARMPEPWYAFRGKKFGSIVARMADGVEPGNVGARATIAWRRMNAFSPDTTRSILLGSIVEGRGPIASRELKITERIAGVAFIVFLVACANIATLSLLRAARRRREVAVRVALGVRRSRLVRQFLTETFLLAGLGGAAAIAFAWGGGSALRGVLLPDVQFLEGVLGLRVVLAVAVLSALGGLLSGLAPALQASRPDLTNALKEGSPSGRLTGSQLRTGLLISQLALSVVLIAGAGLFARSLANLNEVDIGIDPTRTIIVGLRPTARMGDAMTQLADRVRQLQGVERLSAATAGPFIFWNARDVFVPGSDTSISLSGEVPGVVSVDSAFFEALALRVVEGRQLLASDRQGTPPVMVVSETLADNVWPGGSAVGQCLIPFERTEKCYTVVGVVRDMKQWSPLELPRMRYFLPIEQTPQPYPPPTNLFVRAAPENIEAVASFIRMSVRELMPTWRVMWPIVPLSRHLEPEYRPWRVGTGLFVALGALALVVATIGIYSVLAYTMSQRMHEMGVRIALGAQAADVHRLVLTEGLRVVAIGAAIGVLLALAGGRLIASLLYSVSSRDPLTLVASVAILLTAGAVAGAIPAWRASRVDPVVTLRSN